MIVHYWHLFAELIGASFQRVSLVWGIVPLYFTLLLNEITSTKANFRTALQTGFSLLWAAAQWLYPYVSVYVLGKPHLDWKPMPPLSMVVTGVVLLLGVMAFFSGLLHRFPKHCSFLGQTRFSSYFMIAIYPIQAGFLAWTWDRFFAIVIFALPIWLVLNFGLMPLRK
jgi:hypothetical protein